MAVLRRNTEVGICTGPLLRNIWIFAVPIILSGTLQMLFNAADTAVVGQFGNPTAMASVGSTSSLTHMIINVFLGLSTGAGVAVAQGIGAGDRESVRQTVYTSVLLSIVCGVTVAAFGIGSAGMFLRAMGTPSDVLPGAVLYMRIYFIGMPATMLFNFGSSILRSMGDTRRPLIFLLAAGAVNVALNILFVVALHLDVAGVALATVFSQCGAAVLVVRCLVHLPPDVRLDLRRLGVDKRCLRKILRIGLPTGMQASLFSLSNVILQSSINTLGTAAVSAQALVINIDNLISIAMDGVAQSATTFAGQNYGAKQIRRIGRTALDASFLVALIGLAMGIGAVVFTQPILSLFTDDPAVRQIAASRMFLTSSTYFLCGLMEVFNGALCGMGRTVWPMTATLLGICGLRVLWACFVFPLDRTLYTLFISYPVSWTITGTVHGITLLAVLRKERKKHVDPDLSRMRDASA